MTAKHVLRQGREHAACLLKLSFSLCHRYGVLLEDKGIALRGLFIINPEGVLEQV